MDLLFRVEDQFALTMDRMMPFLDGNPSFAQGADRAMTLLNDLLGLYKAALGSGRAGLQAAIQVNPFFGTRLDNLAQAIGLNTADILLSQRS